ncbi:MAG: 3-deoxy-D-manno-octulosonic acid transferase [Desulfuromonadales bacterium]|nr:3-deoxy-D-manno-octulosonic acid transferase [Desulfuromonadales bacterium]
MYFLYNVILIVVALILVPYYLIKGVRFGKTRRGIRERFGWYDKNKLAKLDGKQVFWVHAVSVGETRAAIPLIKVLRKTYPDAGILISNVTETGHAIASEIKEIDACIYFPFDLSWVVAWSLKKIKPAVVIIVETEIWPNFVRHTKRRGTKLIMVNGRISDRSFPRYLRFRGIFSLLLKQFDAFCMQSIQDADRIKVLGAPSAKVSVSRNLKFDMQIDLSAIPSVEQIKSLYRLSPDLLIWVAGSTHAGEEEQLVTVYRQLLAQFNNLVLVLVPRHPQRTRLVADMLSKQGTPYRLRSQLKAGDTELQSGEVLLVDTIGEIMPLYKVADVVFVGGSFVPVGGHNVLEAALLKKPVLFGPYMHNFKEISQLILKSCGGWKVENAKGLAERMETLLQHESLRESVGLSGFGLIDRNAGATAETIAVIDRILKDGDVPV